MALKDMSFKAIIDGARTQPSSRLNKAKVVSITSLDTLASNIIDANNTLVIWEAARVQFEIEFDAERKRIEEHFNAANDELQFARVIYDQLIEQLGLRGIVNPVAVERNPNE